MEVIMVSNTFCQQWHLRLFFILLLASSHAQGMHEGQALEAAAPVAQQDGTALIPEYIPPQPLLGETIHRICHQISSTYHAIPGFIRTPVETAVGIGALLALEHGPDITNWYLDRTNPSAPHIGQDFKNLYAQGNTLHSISTTILGPLLSTPIVLTAQAANANAELLYDGYSSFFGSQNFLFRFFTIFLGGGNTTTPHTYTKAKLISVNFGAVAALMGFPIKQYLTRSILAPHLIHLHDVFRYPLASAGVFYLLFAGINKLITTLIHA